MDMNLGILHELVIDREGLVCCGSCGHNESETTERLNSTEPIDTSKYFRRVLPMVTRIFAHACTLNILNIKKTLKIFKTHLYCNKINVNKI